MRIGPTWRLLEGANATLAVGGVNIHWCKHRATASVNILQGDGQALSIHQHIEDAQSCVVAPFGKHFARNSASAGMGIHASFLDDSRFVGVNVNGFTAPEWYRGVFPTEQLRYPVDAALMHMDRCRPSEIAQYPFSRGRADTVSITVTNPSIVSSYHDYIYMMSSCIRLPDLPAESFQKDDMIKVDGSWIPRLIDKVTEQCPWSKSWGQLNMLEELLQELVGE